MLYPGLNPTPPEKPPVRPRSKKEVEQERRSKPNGDLELFLRHDPAPVHEYHYDYLASPFWHQDAKVRRQRIQAVRAVATHLIEKGKIIFCPISYSRALAEQPEHPEIHPPLGWYEFDLNFLAGARTLYIFEMPGWQESSGVKMELAFAKAKKIPVTRLPWHEMTSLPGIAGELELIHDLELAGRAEDNNQSLPPEAGDTPETGTIINATVTTLPGDPAKLTAELKAQEKRVRKALEAVRRRWAIYCPNCAPARTDAGTAAKYEVRNNQTALAHCAQCERIPLPQALVYLTDKFNDLEAARSTLHAMVERIKQEEVS